MIGDTFGQGVIIFFIVISAYVAGVAFFKAIFWDLDHRVTYRRDDGQLLIEYCLIISLICMVSIVALWLSGVNLNSVLHKIASEV